MIIDKPLMYDELNYEIKNKLKNIKEVIDKLNENSNICVSINGFWGTGKSSYILGLKELYEYETATNVIYFEAWRYANEPDIFLALLEVLYENSDLKSKRYLKKIIKNLGVVSLIGADMLLKKFLDYRVDDITNIFKIVEDKTFEVTTAYKKNKELLKKFFDNKKYVLLIDDLDRLEPKKAYKLLEKLRFYFDFKNVIIIMAINDEVINKYAHNQHSINTSETFDENFLDKIFQYNFELSYSDFNDIHLRSIKKCLDDNKINELKRIFNSLNLKLSHRKWINIINRLEVLFCIENNGINDKAIAIAILKELFSEFNYAYRSSQELLLDENELDYIKKDLNEKNKKIFDKVSNLLFEKEELL